MLPAGRSRTRLPPTPPTRHAIPPTTTPAMRI